MNVTSWESAEPSEQYTALNAHLETDVVIIGGGITGIMSAYLLALEGKRVVVCESERIGYGATVCTTAFVTQVTDMTLVQMKKLFGLEKTKALWHAGRSAIDIIERIIQVENIDCDFLRCSEFLYATKAKDFANLEMEYSTAKELGIDLVLHRVNDLGFANVGSLEIPNQAKFHPIRFVQALARKAELLGVRIFEQTSIVEIVQGEMFTARAELGSVKAKHIIVATSVPFNKPKVLAFKKANYKGYVIDVEIPKGVLKEGMYIDAQTPYRYWRVDFGKAFDRLIIGGADHRQDIPVSETKSFATLERFVKTLLPTQLTRIVHKWSGPLVESIDGLPYIGEFAPRQFLATAFSGNGMTYAALSATMFCDSILGKPNVWKALYDPKRKQSVSLVLTNAKQYIDIFFGGAVKTTFLS
ncbi:MAG: FAD-binding oxidoreductase [Patescibacteria group bacterium]